MNYTELPALRRQFNHGAIVLSVVLIFAVYFTLNVTDLLGFIWSYLAASAVAFYIFRYISNHLHENFDPKTGSVRSSLGIGTGITAVRGVAVALLAALVVASPSPTTWIAAGIYFFVVVCDAVDGFAARSFQHETQLGSNLDSRLDALGILIASILAIKFGRLPPWYLMFSGAYYFYQAGIWIWGRVLNRNTYFDRVQPNPRTRMYAGFQMALLVACLAPTRQIWANNLIATMFMIPSLFTFLRDFLVICGKVQSSSIWYRQFRKQLLQFILVSNPVFARLVTVIFATIILAWPDPHSTIPHTGTGESIVASLFIHPITFLCTTILVSLGILPRMAAIVLCIGVLMVQPESNPPTITDLVLLTAHVYVLLFGSGKWSIFQPETSWLMNRYSILGRASSSPNG